MQDRFRRFFYVSRAVLQPDEVAQLVRRSRQRNAEIEVTGLLAFTGGHFAQMVEGPPEAVQGLVAQIRKDVRHEAMRHLLDVPATSRMCGGWSMRLVESPYADDLVKLLLVESQPPPERMERLLGQLTLPA